MTLVRLPLRTLAAALCLSATTAGAQTTTADPLATALRGTLQRSQRNFVASAEAMPAEKYGYKPTEGHLTFAQHMIHVGSFNETMCELIGGGAKAPSSAKLEPSAPKTAIVDRLRGSFAYCTSALAGLDDRALGASLPFFGSQISRAAAILILSGDWADHYAVTATYLRMNGILPPTAKPTTRS